MFNNWISVNFIIYLISSRSVLDWWNLMFAFLLYLLWEIWYFRYSWGWWNIQNKTPLVKNLVLKTMTRLMIEESKFDFWQFLYSTDWNIRVIEFLIIYLFYIYIIYNFPNICQRIAFSSLKLKKCLFNWFRVNL